MTAQTAREKLAQLEAETKELTAKKNAIRAEVLGKSCKTSPFVW